MKEEMKLEKVEDLILKRWVPFEEGKKEKCDYCGKIFREHSRGWTPDPSKRKGEPLITYTCCCAAGEVSLEFEKKDITALAALLAQQRSKEKKEIVSINSEYWIEWEQRRQSISGADEDEGGIGFIRATPSAEHTFYVPVINSLPYNMQFVGRGYGYRIDAKHFFTSVTKQEFIDAFRKVEHDF